jgi:lytic cellulose monooxygenase (C4-dehydrogenating)
MPYHLPRRRVVAFAALTLIALAGFLVDARPADAHGSAIDPPSRHYGCARRWDTDWQNPAMAVQDPMCWQAWQANPAAMWTWNGLIQDNVNNDHQARVPDAHLCGGGDPTYAALDNPGPWRAQEVGNTFTWTMHDQARHGGAYIRLYVTRQGFDPLTQRLTWGDLELVRDTGPFPDTGWPTTNDPLLNGVSYSFQISAPGRTGRHIVYAVWRAGHADQNYYMCSDVRFPGGPPDPQQPGPEPLEPDSGCTASYTVTSQWGGGFQADVTVTAGPAATTGWQVTMQFLDGQTVGQSWNATATSSGSRVTARNVGYNGRLAAGASTTFGVLGTWLSTNRAPMLSCTAAT